MRARSVFVSLLIIICASISCNGRNNIVGRVSCEGKGIKGVVVSDGISTVQTDSRGRYKMHSEKENGYVFISVPSGYEAERDGIIPRHFVRLEGMKTDKADFNLKKVDQSDCRIIVATDIHMTGDKRDKDLEQFHKTFYPDIVKTASTSDKPVYSVFLGDMSTDGKWYVNSFGLPEYLDLMKDYPSAVFHIMGNHDNERKGEGSDWDHIGESTYKKVIGPNYYSFNIGDVHFMMLDNIVTYGPQPKGTPKGKFNFGTDYGFNYFIDSTQVEWMKKDLSYISSDTPLIVCMHVPLYYGREPGSDGFVAYVKANTSQDINQFMSMFERFGNVHFLFGHEHRTQTFETEKGRTHHIIGSASAVSWKLHDNNAPIVCSDGTPGGYQIFDISGKEISWQFKSSAAAVEHSQMYVYDLNTIPAEYGGEPGSDNLLINIFNWDPAWDIKVYENGHEIEVCKKSCHDPLYTKIRTETRQLGNRPTVFRPTMSYHMFRSKRSHPDSEIKVVVTDRFGNTYTSGITPVLDY